MYITYIENLKQLLLLGRLFHPEKDLLNVGTWLVLLADGDTYGVSDQPSSQLLCPFWDGGRSQQSLMVLRDLVQNF